MSQSPEQHPAPAREQAGQGRGECQSQPRAEARASATASRQGGQAGSKNARTSQGQSAEKAGSQTQARASAEPSRKASTPGTAGGNGLTSGKASGRASGHATGHTSGKGRAAAKGKGVTVISLDSPKPEPKPTGQEAPKGSGNSTAYQPLRVSESGDAPKGAASAALTPELLPPEPADSCQRGGAVLSATLATVRDNSPSCLPQGYRPPSFAEVEMYCAMRGNGLEPRRFMDWCEARGWRVGGQLVRDWRALVRRFEQRERNGEGLGGGGFGGGSTLPALPALRPAATAVVRPVLPQAAPIPTLESAPALGFASLRASTVHQAQVRERDLMARMILNENRSLHARQSGNPAPSGSPCPALPPEWADGV